MTKLQKIELLIEYVIDMERYKRLDDLGYHYSPEVKERKEMDMAKLIWELTHD